MNLPFRGPGGDGPGSGFDARPIVAVRRQDRTGWWFAGGAVVAAALLFTTLEARRQGLEQADIGEGSGGLAPPQSVPDLVIPNLPADAGQPSDAWPQPGDARSQRTASLPAASTRPSYAGGGYAPSPIDDPYFPPPPPAMVPGTEEMPAPAKQQFSQPNAGRPGAPSISGSIQAGRLANPAATVIQGTLINAVLETAIDSTGPGQTRAVVTRDVYGFDGSRILVPRGTRLYGIYESEVAQGQKRAQIRWSRLLTPEGVSVALDSPAADPLGRAGVEARVDTHFFQRFGNALLGTASAVGSSLMTRNIGNSPVVVAVPGTAQASNQLVGSGSNQIMPTLTVRQGKRISVFVQHDLDFSAIDQAPPGQ